MCQTQIGIYIKQIPFGKPTHAQNTEANQSNLHVGYTYSMVNQSKSIRNFNFNVTIS